MRQWTEEQIRKAFEACFNGEVYFGNMDRKNEFDVEFFEGEWKEFLACLKEK